LSGEFVLKTKQYSPWLEEKINFFRGRISFRAYPFWGFTAAAQRLILTRHNFA